MPTTIRTWSRLFMNFKISSLIISCLAMMLVFNSCAELPKVVTVNNGERKSKTIKVVRKALGGELIKKDEIISRLSFQLAQSGDSPRSYEEKDGSPSKVIMQGVRPYISDTDVTLEFINGERFTSTKNIYGSKITASYPFIIEEKGDFYIVTLFPPTNYRKEVFPMIKCIIDDDKIESVLLSKFDDIQSIPITGVVFYEGEIISKNNHNRVYNNFARLATAYGPNKFHIKHENKQYSVHIEYSPYRSGSKIRYKIYIPYVITDKHPSFDALSKELVSIVKRIAND